LLVNEVAMINFNCKNCGQKLKVPDQNAGKKAKCPKCNNPLLIPSPPEQSPQKPSLIKFRCPSCGQKIGLTTDYAGKTVKCAKCKNPLRVPQPRAKPTPPPVTDETAVLRAGHEQPSQEKNIWQDMENLDELLLQESSAPSVEPPPDQAPADYALADAEPDEYAAQMPHPPALAQGPAGPKKKKPIIIITACVIGLLIVGAVVWSLIPDFEQPDIDIESQFELTEVQEFAEQYIGLLEDGDIDRAMELLNPELQTDTDRQRIEKLAKRIDKDAISNLNCTVAHSEKLPDGNQFYLWCNISYEKDTQTVILSLRESQDQLTVDGIALRHVLDGTASVGPDGYEDLAQIILSAKAEEFVPIFAGFFCGILIVILVVGLIQMAAMWVIFDKAGEPGWASIVPFYNMWVLAEVGDLPGWLGLLACFAGAIPFAGPLAQFVLWAVISINVAKAFDRGVLFGIGLTIFPFIFYPVLAFSS
jgi:DNA-directed RNA polymerase subunit RPC12/RpoP